MKIRIIENKDLIEIPEEVQLLADIAESNGIKLYVVGGPVRDSLMGITPKDWDMSTPALPDDIIRVYEESGLHVVPVGLKHGTVGVVVNGEVYEITTFRVDKNVGDKHNEVEHEFINDLEKDLERRDLTINSICFDISNNEIIDPFGGQDDLRNGLIKTVGDPDDKFIGAEYGDPLRILRVFRFASRYGFTIDDKILKSIKKNKNSIKTVSVERIRDEMTKILMTNKPSNILRLMKETELLEVILPEIKESYDFPQNNPNHIFDVFEHTIRTLDNAKPVSDIRWALLLHDLGKSQTRGDRPAGGDSFIDHAEKSYEIAIDVLNRLKFTNKSKSMILSLVKHHDLFAYLNPKKTVKFKRKMQELIPSKKDYWNEWEKVGDIEREKKMSIFNRLDNINYADTSAQNPELFNMKKKRRDSIMKKYNDIVDSGDPIYISDLAINGKDIMDILNIPGGKKIKEIQEKLLELVIAHPEFNTKEKLTLRLKKWFNID